MLDSDWLSGSAKLWGGSGLGSCSGLKPVNGSKCRPISFGLRHGIWVFGGHILTREGEGEGYQGLELVKCC